MAVVLLNGIIPVPQLMLPATSAGLFSARVQTLCRKSYALEYKDSLAATNWTPLPATAGNGALRVLTDPTATATQRFYRMRQW